MRIIIIISTIIINNSINNNAIVFCGNFVMPDLAEM